MHKSSCIDKLLGVIQIAIKVGALHSYHLDGVVLEYLLEREPTNITQGVGIRFAGVSAPDANKIVLRHAAQCTNLADGVTVSGTDNGGANLLVGSGQDLA